MPKGHYEHRKLLTVPPLDVNPDDFGDTVSEPLIDGREWEFAF